MILALPIWPATICWIDCPAHLETGAWLCCNHVVYHKTEAHKHDNPGVACYTDSQMYVLCTLRVRRLFMMEPMMSIILPTLPITDLRTKQPDVLNQLQQSPVVLTHRGHGAAVLVSPEQWNKQQRELQRLRLVLEAMQIKARGEPTVALAELKQRIAEKRAASHVGD
jgi:PHD/YefM family antitoxin component YafN of YafNO toxin-antitoxin module